MVKEYYRTPPQEVFDEVKAKCIEIWRSYDDEYGYASKKIARVEEINNCKDNMMGMIAMFDYLNQIKLANLLSARTRAIVLKKLESVTDKVMVLLPFV